MYHYKNAYDLSVNVIDLDNIVNKVIQVSGTNKSFKEVKQELLESLSIEIEEKIEEGETSGAIDLYYEDEQRMSSYDGFSLRYTSKNWSKDSYDIIVTVDSK